MSKYQSPEIRSLSKLPTDVQPMGIPYVVEAFFVAGYFLFTVNTVTVTKPETCTPADGCTYGRYV